ncbi:hypothetical protein GCM10010124_03490 [Pilimelia terevasa]|uniref:Cell envelope-related transcriptional attenuator domain-containing protein n=1 Tax=Pilimelia terevasa TaxID=53372 RepID=A0A8J3BDS9_9ACTN|nr:LCP family protein [Pilimelia terevasa]GGK14224.1 hypothetical protein GCM10010124_03490 [Pilimelia terevasa]
MPDAPQPDDTTEFPRIVDGPPRPAGPARGVAAVPGPPVASAHPAAPPAATAPGAAAPAPEPAASASEPAAPATEPTASASEPAVPKPTGSAPGTAAPDVARPRRRTRRALVLALAGVAALAVAVGGTAAVRGVSRGVLPRSDLLGGTSGADPSPPAATPGLTGRQLRGPLNILIAGVDPRQGQPNWRPNADAVLLLHVPRTLDAAYLYSLPRDLVVTVPAFGKAGFGGTRTKLTHAMSFGSVVPGTARPDRAQGFQLLARTVSAYSGIPRFDAGAVLDFGGFVKLVDAVGGVDLRVDQKVTSIHRQPDGAHRRPGASSTGYVGPQMTYLPGVRHFAGWQALDYGRQRYVAGSDYTRQKHQQQLVRAILAKLAKLGAHRDPVRLARVLAAVRESLTYDGRGHEVQDFAYTLRRIPPAKLTLVSLPGAALGRGNAYQGEALTPVATGFLRAVRAGAVAPYLAKNPSLVHSR